jgi:hypothetical protein
LLDTAHGYVSLVEPDQEGVTIKVGIGSFSQHIGYRAKFGEGLTGRVWQTGQLVVVDDYDLIFVQKRPVSICYDK